MLSYVAPTVSVSISESQTPIALRNYTLMCDVNASPTLDLTTTSYTWMRTEVAVPSEQTNELVFNSLPLSENNTVYTCQYRALSLSSSVDVTSPGHTISITSKYIDTLC